MFDTYAQLKEQVASFLWDREDAAAKIPVFIQLAEAEARRLLRTRQTTDSVPFTISSATAGIPCDAGSIKAIRIDDPDESSSRELDYMSPERWASLGSMSSGWPRFYTIQNDRIYFAPHGDEPIKGSLVYIGPFCPLSDTCRTNWLLKKHPDIYLCGALKWAKAWLIDSDQDWSSPFYAAISAANRDDPRVQMNTKLRADEATAMGSRHKTFDIRTGGF